MASTKSELRDGMRIDWDVPIKMDDGLVLRADVYRPEKEGRFPVILSYGPYAKGLAFQDGYPSAWQRMVAEHPDVAHGIEHWTHFYTDYGRMLQLRFFNHFLKVTGHWPQQPRVQLQVSHVGKFVE